jgi:hypothetical protein
VAMHLQACRCAETRGARAHDQNLNYLGFLAMPKQRDRRGTDAETRMSVLKREFASDNKTCS